MFPQSGNTLRKLLALASPLLAAAPLHAELVATFTREGVTDARLDRLPAINVEAGESATPFLTPGAFQGVWTGKLVMSARQRVVFSFEGEGKVTLKVDGKELLVEEGTLGTKKSESTRLNAGEHEFELTYSSKEDGTGSLRVFWEEQASTFVRQALPPTIFKATPNEAVTLGALQRRGREVFATQNCTKCHMASAAGFGAKPMPEISDLGPLLVGTGDRTSEEWLRKWIADPHKLKPTTNMPALVDASTPEGQQKVSDLAAYLSGMKMGTPPGAATDPALVKEGGAHFHELGCVACHNPPDKGVADPKRVPLNNVASKYQPGALVGFLKLPEMFHGSIKMPNFQMSDAEANSIAAYLTAASTGQETKLDHKFPAGDAARGAEVAKSLQCGVCHPGAPMAPEALPVGFDDLFKKDWSAAGCVAPTEKRGTKAPHLNIDDNDRAALVAFSKNGQATLGRDTTTEYTMRQIHALRCDSCHGLDSALPTLSDHHGETASLIEGMNKLHERVDQTRPNLTFTGEMLYTTAIQGMIGGTTKPRPRPWLGMRMPSFGAMRATPMANGFSKIHGLAPNTPAEVKIDEAMAQIGKDLAGSKGFDCTGCHGIGDMKPTAAFEVEGVNFSLVPSRLREDFYYRWMDNPHSVTPSTKMPPFSKDGKSQRTDVLEGDSKKQFEAIWQYIHQGGK